jgi:hypothetical protein
MEDRPQDRVEDRRRRGPLGDDDEGAEETRGVPQTQGGEEATTHRISPEDTERDIGTSAPDAEGTPPEVPGEEDPETRVIRTPREDEATPYPRDYLEAVDQREARLREVYGGVDWLASFVGCVFAIVCGGVLLSFLSSLVLVPLGFTLTLEGRGINVLIIAGLVIIGLVLFIAYLCGGYVAGRLARFDGGRNGVATVLWGILLSMILLLVGGFLPGSLFELLREFVRDSVWPVVGGLTETGLAGVGVVIGALLLELLGGFLGGRLGNSYHTRIDHTT